MSEINWDDNAKKAISAFYDFIDEQGVTYVSTDKMKKDFFEWLIPPQQTKTVADKGEKWTHVDDAEDKCFIIHTKGDLAWVSYERSICDCVVPFKDLKPIKPKLTEGEREKVAKFIARIYTKESYDLRQEFDDFCNEHDIVDN